MNILKKITSAVALIAAIILVIPVSAYTPAFRKKYASQSCSRRSYHCTTQSPYQSHRKSAPTSVYGFYAPGFDRAVQMRSLPKSPTDNSQL